MTKNEALCAIQEILLHAYHRRFPVCCGKSRGNECCGDVGEGWIPVDKEILDVLGPVEKWIRTCEEETDKWEVNNPKNSRMALIRRLKSLKVILSVDSPEVRGWAPSVQQESTKIVNDAIRALRDINDEY